MNYRLPALAFRVVVTGLLLAGLGGCKIFHPYRLPTPKPSPEFVAQQKAAKKAKNAKTPSGLFKKRPATPSEEAATDVSTPTGGTVTVPTAAPETRTLPERSTVRYDKNGLMKKPKLTRRKVHKYHKPFRPWESIRHFFKYGLHGKPNYDPDHRPVPRVPAAPPDAVPDAAPKDKP